MVLLVAVIGGISGIAGAYLGAKVGADAAREAAKITQAESQADREEARRARFAESVRHLAAQLLVSGHTHMDEVNLQINSRIGTNPVAADTVPTVGSTEPMKALVQELALTVRDPATAQAAQRFYATTAWLPGGLIYIAQRDRKPDGTARLIADADFQAFQGKLDRWGKDRRAFVNAVRLELGAEPFPDAHD